MKVVLFCGGFGLRLREFSESTPKPLVPIGFRPIIWHIMRYYAHFGHKDFILCLGWQGNLFKDYFLNYNECLSNDFVLDGRDAQNGRKIDLISSDIDDWRITFVDTGMSANIGQRLMAVRHHLEGEETFLANYSDGLTDLHLPDLIDYHHRNDSIATFMSVKPTHSFHTVQMNEDGRVTRIAAIGDADVWMNVGYFVLNQQIFDYMEAGDELVLEPFERLIEINRLHSLRYEGFFGCMDTFKEKQALDDMNAKGDTPWKVWRTNGDKQAHGNGARPNHGQNGACDTHTPAEQTPPQPSRR